MVPLKLVDSEQAYAFSFGAIKARLRAKYGSAITGIDYPCCAGKHGSEGICFRKFWFRRALESART
jgi:hypothetical protein